MSPVVIDRIRNADDVRIVEENNSYSIQIKKDNTWTVILTKDDRQLCEDTIRTATSKTLFG